MAFENFKLKREAKKAEKEYQKDKKHLETLQETVKVRTDSAIKRDQMREPIETETSTGKLLEKKKLDDEIHKARKNLYIQRDKLLRRIRHYNAEYADVAARPDSAKKTKEMLRCSSISKNAVFALCLVEDAIDKLDDIPSEYEWHELMRDLTAGYKTVNAISVGSDLMTRLAYWLQKAKLDLKGNISVHAMEHYYGRPIDELLENENVDGVASQLLVKDEALQLQDEKDILESVRWRTIYTVDPTVVNKAVYDQSVGAKGRYAPIIENPTYEQRDITEQDYEALDEMPGVF
ncbi:MAG: hypothetical protein IK104_04090 [Clostridia bacterium]|nr:hypothetical protein [Clostridia bacterium]